MKIIIYKVTPYKLPIINPAVLKRLLGPFFQHKQESKECRR